MPITPPQYSPIPELDDRYKATIGSAAFAATTRPQAIAWQDRTRPALARLLGFVDDPPIDPQPRELESVDCGPYVRKKIEIRTSPNSQLPLYLLIPKDAPGPMPCMLIFHGHGYGVKSALGLTEDSRRRESPDPVHQDFGDALARQGYVVAAPEISCFGERQQDYSHLVEKRRPRTCHSANAFAMMLGGTIAGLRVRDGLRVADYLASVPEADTARLGAMGISGGGMHTFFSAAMDLRIRAVVISGYFCPWRHSILGMQHCTCNYVPGLLKLGEIDDLAGLLAPRPLFIEHGTQDDLFPIEHARPAMERAQKAWKLLGNAGDFETEIFEGGHRLNGAGAYAFLKRHLKG